MKMKVISSTALFLIASNLFATTKPIPTQKPKTTINTTFFPKQKMEELYKDLSGFGIAQDEYKTIRESGGAPTYGEITYESTETLFDILKLTTNDVIYDLGSGVGKFIIQAYLNTTVKKAVGVELSSTRIKRANEALYRLKAKNNLRKNA